MNEYPRCQCKGRPVIVTEYRQGRYWPVEGPVRKCARGLRKCGPVEVSYPRLVRCGIKSTEPWRWDAHSGRIITQWRCRRCTRWYYFC